MLYSKFGSIPKPQTDGTEGWVEVPDAPTDIPEGHELFWDGFEWVIIPPKPESRPGYTWAFYKTQGWVESPDPVVAIEVIELTPPAADSAVGDSIGADSVAA